MTDYTKLVEALRCCDEYALCNDCPIFETCDGDVDKAMAIAAAAIEALQAAEPTERQVVDYCHKRCLVVLEADLFHELKASYGKLPKRGEIVRCGECKWYDPLDRKRPFFCPVMDCATGVMEDDFCSRGERRAKMEVQDG